MFQFEIPSINISDLRGGNARRIAIGDAFVDDTSFREVHLAVLRHAISRGKPSYVVTANAQHIVLLRHDRRLRKAYENAGLVVADGVSLLLASRLFGQPLRGRVTGIDLFQALCLDRSATNLKVFLLGGSQGAADLAASWIQERNKGIRVGTYCPPRGFDRDPAELERINNLITSENPNILFVGLGAPKQEYWIYENFTRINVPVCMGVGGSFEMVSGREARAPRWVRSIGCEWLHRLYQDPRNKWRRYLIGNIRFIFITLEQFFRNERLTSRAKEVLEVPIVRPGRQ